VVGNTIIINQVVFWSFQHDKKWPQKRKIMYFILEDVHNSFYTEAIANDQFPSLQAAEKKLQALEELKPKGKYFIVTRVQA
jgi:hypothetical protein|tara:strand:- start:143 stop:385 length:243 start_codon:yes stop_codon:yes gene_type:complete